MKNQFSLIIPAHNEETTIARLLENSNDKSTRNGEVIVVCNGCSDRTAEVSRMFEPAVTVIETNISSKSNALNIGDNASTLWPRIYADADIILNSKSINSIAEKLNEEDVYAVSPIAVTLIDRSDWIVKAFYKVWTRLPYFKAGMIGCGVYGLTQKARNRFKEWPDIIADDGYIRALFNKDERKICENAKVIVQAPRTLSSLIFAKTRSRLGRYQLKLKFPELLANERSEKHYFDAMRAFLLQPNLLICLPIYIAINIITRFRAKQQIRKLNSYKWERDLSTR